MSYTACDRINRSSDLFVEFTRPTGEEGRLQALELESAGSNHGSFWNAPFLDCLGSQGPKGPIQPQNNFGS